MEKKLKYSLILLTLNEIDGLNKVFKDIPLHEFDDIFAIDGGSTDGTLEFYKNNNVRVVTQESRGRGEAFRIAAEVAQGDVMIFFSPDGNEDPKDLPKFKKYFNDDGYDMVIASRMMKGAYNEEDEDFFKWRKWANNTFNLLANLFFRRVGPYVTDSINGYRAITKEAFKKVQPDGKGYTIEYQMTIRAFKKKLKIAEFPTHEYPRAGGESYAKSIPTGIAFMKLFFKELFKN
jgi:glycosyltransferase involved in cell wall biosynthesis